jgi:carbon monoxide dehydrogenase subunit G
MRLENSFEVAVRPEQAWALLVDVPRVVPCMPGAELTETIDERTWRGLVRVRLGPVGLLFAADVVREEQDDEARRMVLVTKARETRGRGSALATVESTLGEAGEGTVVSIVTELTLQGPVAQLGRGIVPDVAAQLTQEFAANVAALLAQGDPAEPDGAPTPPAAAAPVSGLRLGLRALWHAGLRRLRRPR